MIPIQVKIISIFVFLAFLISGGAIYRHHVYEQGFSDANSQRAIRDNIAMNTRKNENSVLLLQQTVTNSNITKVKNEDINSVRNHINADRVRVSSSICGPTTTTKTDDATSSIITDTSSRLVSNQFEEDIRALEIEVEEALATGRACQEFGRANGFLSDH